MTKAVEVITSVQRRRRWSHAEKERLVAAALEPGAVASDLARAAGIYPSQLYRWRQELCAPTAAPASSSAFSAVGVLPEPVVASPASSTPGAPEPAGVIEIEFAGGGRMQITGPVDRSTVSALLKSLTKGKRRR